MPKKRKAAPKVDPRTKALRRRVKAKKAAAGAKATGVIDRPLVKARPTRTAAEARKVTAAKRAASLRPRGRLAGFDDFDTVPLAAKPRPKVRRAAPKRRVRKKK